jgi:hypothetical protein
MTAADRRKTAAHEAGHALALYLTTNRPPELVSTRPGKSFGGVMIPAELPSSTDELLRDTPSIFQPEGLRRALEARICVFVAGEIAEHLAVGLFPPLTVESKTADTAAAETTAATLSRLAPRHRDLLAVAEAATQSVHDAEQAQRPSWLLTGRWGESSLHVLWLQAVTQDLLVRHTDALRRLTEALELAGGMDGDAFEAVIAESRCACHSFTNSRHPAREQHEPSAAALVADKKKGDAS